MTIDGADIYDLIPKMAMFRDLQEIPEDGNTLDDTTRKLNQVIAGLKWVAENQQFVSFDEPSQEDEGTEG